MKTKTIKDELLDLKEDLKALEKTMEGNVLESGDELFQQAKDKLSNIANKIKNEAEPMIESLEKSGKQINKYVTNNKWESIGIALGAGIVAGLLMRCGKK